MVVEEENCFCTVAKSNDTIVYLIKVLMGKRVLKMVKKVSWPWMDRMEVSHRYQPPRRHSQSR